MDSRQNLHRLVTAALFAAAIAVMTAYLLHIPLPTGGYIHLGDAVIYLAAALLPTPYALAAAAIGGGLADLLTAPLWLPATIVIKMLIALPFTCKSAKIITPRNIAAAVIACAVTVIGYFAAEYLIFGTWAALAASISGNLIQSGGSAVVFIIIGLALDKTRLKTKLI